jgi:hypothetical protein
MHIFLTALLDLDRKQGSSIDNFRERRLGRVYEDILEWAKDISSKEIVERLASDLEVSLDYPR